MHNLYLSVVGEFSKKRMRSRGGDLIESIDFDQVFMDKKVYVNIKRKFFTFKDRKP